MVLNVSPAPPIPIPGVNKSLLSGGKKKEGNITLLMVLHDVYEKSKKCEQKNCKIYESGPLQSRCSDGGDRNPGGGVILPEARGGPWANILMDIYIYTYICTVFTAIPLY